MPSSLPTLSALPAATMPRSYINNKDVASLMIVNESQQQRSSVRPGVAGVDSELIVRWAGASACAFRLFAQLLWQP